MDCLCSHMDVNWWTRNVNIFVFLQVKYYTNMSFDNPQRPGFIRIRSSSVPILCYVCIGCLNMKWKGNPQVESDVTILFRYMARYNVASPGRTSEEKSCVVGRNKGVHGAQFPLLQVYIAYVLRRSSSAPVNV